LAKNDVKQKGLKIIGQLTKGRQDQTRTKGRLDQKWAKGRQDQARTKGRQRQVWTKGHHLNNE